MTQHKNRADMFNTSMIRGMEKQVAIPTLTPEKKEAIQAKILAMRAKGNR